MLKIGTGLLSKKSNTCIMDMYGLSTTIPDSSFRSSFDNTMKAEAFEELIYFLYLGKKSKAIDSFDDNFISSTDEILIDSSPINSPPIFLANSLRVITSVTLLFC